MVKVWWGKVPSTATTWMDATKASLSLASFCVAASLVPVFGKPSDQIRVEAPPVAAAFLPQPQEWEISAPPPVAMAAANAPIAMREALTVTEQPILADLPPSSPSLIHWQWPRSSPAWASPRSSSPSPMSPWSRRSTSASARPPRRTASSSSTWPCPCSRSGALSPPTRRSWTPIPESSRSKVCYLLPLPTDLLDLPIRFTPPRGISSHHPSQVLVE